MLPEAERFLCKGKVVGCKGTTGRMVLEHKVDQPCFEFSKGRPLTTSLVNPGTRVLRRNQAAQEYLPSSSAMHPRMMDGGVSLASLTAAAGPGSMQALKLPPWIPEAFTRVGQSIRDLQPGSSSASVRDQHRSHGQPSLEATSRSSESQQQQQQQQQQQLPSTSKHLPDVSDPFGVVKHLFSGAMSAVVSRTCVAPLERVRMELVLKQSTGTAMATAADVLRTEGVWGFWKGNGINILRTAPFKALNFFAFDTYHKFLVKLLEDDGNLARFTAGAFAGMTATIVCFPLDVVRTRLLSKCTAPRYGGPVSTLFGILRHEGIHGLYSGCLPAVMGMVPAGSIFYGVFDLLKHQHLQRLAESHPGEEHHLGPLQTLMFGAAAGMASELIVYPLEVVRRRMQMQSMVMAAARAGTLRGTPVITAAAAEAGLYRVISTCRDVFKAEGLAGFYSGMAPNLLQVLPSSSLSYYTYDTCKQLLKVDGR